MRTFLSEAFKALNLLEEDKFDISNSEDFDKFKLFMDDDSDDNAVTVIDTDAESEEELEDSYDGKIICDCPVCHSKIFKSMEDIVLNDEDDLANVGEECPYCYSVDGFKIIGEVAPFHKDYDATATDKDGNPVDVEVSVDDEVDETKLEALKRRIRKAQRINESRKRRNESLEKLDLETENDLIHVTAETKDEQIVPVDMDTQDEIEMEQPLNSDDFDFDMESDDTVEDEETDEMSDEMSDDEELPDEVDVDEFDEESFDELGEAYLKQVYKNVRGFKTRSIKESNNSIIVEGVIKFKSGNNKITSFKFRPSHISGRNTVRLLGENLNFAPNRNSFSLTGKIKGSRFITEKFTYNYINKDSDGKRFRVHGSLKR